MMRLRLVAAAARWRAFTGHSPLRRLGSDALVAVVTSMFAKGFGFVKEVLIAALFGISGALDIYLMAIVLMRIPSAFLSMRSRLP